MKSLIVLISMLLAFSVSCDVDDGKDKYLAPDEIGVEWQLSEDPEWYTLDVDIRRLNNSKRSDYLFFFFNISYVDMQPDSQIVIEFHNADGSISELIIDSSNLADYFDEYGNSGLMVWQRNTLSPINLDDMQPTAHIAVRFAKAGVYTIDIASIVGDDRYGNRPAEGGGCSGTPPYYSGRIDIPIDARIAVP
jgi:hypothetical protein